MNPQALVVWWQGLPPWGRPLLISIVVGASVMTYAKVRYQVRLMERGDTARVMPKVSLWQAAIFMAALAFLRESNKTAADILTLPDRIDYYHAHGGALWLGFLAGGLAGLKIGDRIAPSVFRRHAAKLQRMGSELFGWPEGAMPANDSYWEDAQ